MFMVSRADAAIDLVMTVDSATYTPNAVNGTIDIMFDIQNIGTTDSGPVSLFIEFDAGDFSDTFTGDPSPFSGCTFVSPPLPAPSGISCFDSLGIIAGDTAQGNFVLNVTSTSAVDIPLPFTVTDDAGLDTNPGNNITIPTVILGADLQLNTLTPPNPINPFTPHVVTSFQFENMNSNIALESDVKLEVTFDNNNFTFNTATTLPPLWNCGSIANKVTCDCTGASCTSGIGLNTQYDFALDFASNIPTPPGNYNFGAGLIYLGTPIAGVSSNQAVTINPAQTDLSIIKSAEDLLGNSIPNIPVGGLFQYVLSVTNDGLDAPMGQVIVSDTLPANVNFSGTAPTATGWSCTATGAGNKIISCMNTTVFNNGGNVNFTIPVTAGSTAGSVSNSASVNPLTGSTALFLDSDTSNNTSVASVTLNPAGSGSINITKTVAQPNYTIGDDVIYTITVENTSATDSFFDLVISDLLPGNYLDLNPSNVSVVANTITGTSVFTCTFGTVIDTASCDNTSSTSLFNPGDRVEIIITATANAVGTAIANTANYSSTSLNLSGSSAPALINISQASVIRPTSIAVQKTVTQNGVQVSEIAKGSSFQYEVVVTNTGDYDVSSFSIIDDMPQEVVVDSIVIPAGMTCNNQGQTYNCNNTQGLPTNSSVQVIFNVTDVSASETTSLLNRVRVVSFNAQEKFDEALVILTGTNPNPNPNAQYTHEIKDDVDPVQQGDDFNYIVSLTNTGTVALSAIDIKVLLPQDLLVNSTTTNGVTCSTITTGLHCLANGGLLLNPGEQVDIVIVNVVSQNYFGDVFVEVHANNTGSVTISDNETTTILESISVPIADLSISILNTQTATQGGQSSFDVNIENQGDSALTPRVTVGLSGLIDTVQAQENQSWTCDVSGLVVNCQYIGASVPSGHNSTIHFDLNLSRISVQSEDIIISASVESDTEDDVLENNTASSTISVNPTPTEGEILSALQSALDGKANQQVNRAIQNVASYCEVSYFKALEGLCSDLYQTALDGDGETINTVMEQITPNEVIGQSTSIAEIATAQFRNVGSRLAVLRSGGGSGFSSAGLNARLGNGSIPIGMLTYLNKSADESKDIDVNNDFISPWGFFVNGTISMGSRDATGRELGFDFDSYGLTAGVDYRLSANKVVGVALGYANFDSDIDGQANLKSTGLTLTGYGSFYVNDNFYVDARISVAKPDFDQSRKIDFTLGDTTISRVANGSTSSNQYSVAMSAGYNFYKNSWNITPNGSFRYIKTTIDGFTETGAGGFNFNYSEQDLESMIWSAGIKVSKAISLKNGVITPQFDFDYNYESLNDGNDIEARFVTAPLGEVFIIETDSPDRTYGSAGLGFAYISSNGKQAYINYRSVLGLEGFSRGTFNLGARFEF